MTEAAPNPASVERAAEVLGKYVGTMRHAVREPSVVHISALSCGSDLADLTISELAHLHRHPEHPMREKVESTCSQGCGTTFQCERWVSQITACDACRSKSDEEDAMARAKKHWEKICPKGFRDTDKTHAGFPKAQLAQLKDWTGTKSLFFYGPTGQGKTRLALLMLKRAMMKNHWVGVLWPDKLNSLTQGFDTSTFDKYAAYDVLLMDDPLISAGRQSKLVDTLKNLIDVRMREQRATIITSQIGTEQEMADAKEFGEAKAADLERIKAIVRRLREDCLVISFATAVPVMAEQEEAF